MSKLTPDHIVLDFTPSPSRLRCMHCGASQAVPTPAPISAVLDALKTFEAQHTDCKKAAQ